jgi:hypothetical protein
MAVFSNRLHGSLVTHGLFSRPGTIAGAADTHPIEVTNNFMMLLLFGLDALWWLSGTRLDIYHVPRPGGRVDDPSFASYEVELGFIFALMSHPLRTVILFPFGFFPKILPATDRPRSRRQL